MKYKKGKLKRLAIGAITVFFVAATLCIVTYSRQNRVKDTNNHPNIYEGVTVEGIDVGGLSQEDAKKLLKTRLQDALQEKSLTLKTQEKSWSISYQDLNANYDYESAAEAAYEIGRTGADAQKAKEIKQARNSRETIRVKFTYEEDALKEWVETVAKELDTAAVNSAMVRANGAFILSDEKSGWKMDQEKALQELSSLVEMKEEGTISIVAREVKPQITKAMNESATTLLGSFSTRFSGGAKGRNENLRVGCEHINNTIVLPGEVFSMNKALGPQTYANGYRDAAVIVNGKIEDGLGGGVCQVTTTLYNAVIFAELPIVERRNHSLMVAYVPLGRDAAVAGNYTDFKFKNDTDYPLYIEAFTTDKEVIANVYGHEVHQPGRTVEFEKVFLETVAKPAEKITENSTLPAGYKEITFQGKTGAKVSTYKKVYQDGNLVSREWFTNSTYKATADEVTVGTKQADASPVISPDVGTDPKKTEGNKNQPTVPPAEEPKQSLPSELPQEGIAVEEAPPPPAEEAEDATGPAIGQDDWVEPEGYTEL